jgi:hypothetical protein
MYLYELYGCYFLCVGCVANGKSMQNVKKKNSDISVLKIMVETLKNILASNQRLFNICILNTGIDFISKLFCRLPDIF